MWSTGKNISPFLVFHQKRNKPVLGCTAWQGKRVEGSKLGRDREWILMPLSHSVEVHFSLSVQGWTLCIFMVNLFTEPLLKFWKQRKCICSITFPDLTSPIKSIKAFNEIPARSQLPWMNVESEFKLKCCFCSLWALALTEIKGTVHILGSVAFSLYFFTAILAEDGCLKLFSSCWACGQLWALSCKSKTCYTE